MSSTVAQNIVSNEKESGNAAPLTGIDVDGERDDEGVDEMKYPTGWRLIAIAISIVLSMFLVLPLVFDSHAIED